MVSCPKPPESKEWKCGFVVWLWKTKVDEDVTVRCSAKVVSCVVLVWGKLYWKKDDVSFGTNVTTHEVLIHVAIQLVY